MLKSMPDKNMGAVDRVIRGALGGALLSYNLIQGKNSLAKIIGGAFLFYSITGWDPLLTLFKTNTFLGDQKNIRHKLRSI